jgi:hypothetical protein
VTPGQAPATPGRALVTLGRAPATPGRAPATLGRAPATPGNNLSPDRTDRVPKTELFPPKI